MTAVLGLLLTAFSSLSAPPLPAQKPENVVRTSFEELESGAFTALVTSYGSLRARKGDAEIDSKHARSGAQCLWIHGGEERAVELVLSRAGGGLHELRFWAERWTRRAPFRFRVEARAGSGWRELYDGDAAIRVGGFLTEVRIDLTGTKVSRLRFVCTAPEGTGILIDDLSVSRPAPMRLRSVENVETVVPVLLDGGPAPLAALSFETEGNLEPLAFAGLDAVLLGTAPEEDLTEVRLYYTGASAEFSTAQPLGAARTPAAALRFDAERELAPGPNHFWLAGTPAKAADLDHVVDAMAVRLRLRGVPGSGDEAVEMRVYPHAGPAQRFGLALRRHGDDGVHTHRIPGLATTNSGTLLAVYDLRHANSRDLPGDIDVALSRSTDGGRTWEAPRKILDQGPPHGRNGVGDPSILVDRITGRVWVAALWAHGDNGWNGSGPGLAPEDTGQLLLVHSDDDGRTWSRPRNLTREVKRPEWRLFLQGPGKGICMRDGTLVFPAQFRDAEGLPHSTLIHSTDHGKTWTVGSGARPDTTEAQAVELASGALMLNMRDNRGGSRSVAVTRDLGRTWTAHPSSRGALVEPVCMASLIGVPASEATGGRALLAFSNPAVRRAPRRRITVKLSADEGATWPEAWHTLLDAGAGRGYSCLTVLDADTLGILYESSQADLVFQRLPLRELLGAAELPR